MTAQVPEFSLHTHRAWCIHLKSHLMSAPYLVRCGRLNAQYTHVAA